MENIPKGETFVVMSNHQSLYDIPVLQVALPLTVRMVAKSELFKVPLWSQAMLAAGYVPIHRGDHTKTLQDLRAAQKAIERGISIWIAPEGTRSPDGRLLAFKPGGFHLASAVKARILPVTLDGTRHCLEAKIPSRQSRCRRQSDHRQSDQSARVWSKRPRRLGRSSAERYRCTARPSLTASGVLRRSGIS
ncbi:MAG: lysophospholipid acyltransferase family protein [Polyangiaceae bacterium]